ncbi:ligand-binding sensor domain-containing protein [Aquisphaera insulae]|uniref:ligand-binding sensor domain-containing protein n=1 Tax=Aquisphaera insulae TaxID=2712864 RepID=UPI0013EB2528|nr:regulator [Aquisphaera insulae]
MKLLKALFLPAALLASLPVGPLRADEPRPAKPGAGPTVSPKPAPPVVPGQVPLAATQIKDVPDDALPYVYTKWKNFTTKDGLPNDHIFSVKAEGPKVWIGTEDGLACLDKRTGKIRSWKEKDGLPFQAVTAIDVDRNTGDVWLGLFGGGLARFSGGRFDHFNQLNSGLVNDVVYGVAIEGDSVWAATTAGCSRYNTKTHEWTIFNEKNAPMEEIWNYSVSHDKGKVYLGVWGSGCLEYDLQTKHWKEYLDPDGEMEIDLYRDDGIVHVIVTGATHVDGALWISSYFGNCRYDGRNWRGFYSHETGIPSDFTNAVRGRSAAEGWYGTDKGVGVVADFFTDTYVAYTRDPQSLKGLAKVYRRGKLLKTVEMETGVPHNFIINFDIDGKDVWVATGKGLGWAIGDDYFPGVKTPDGKPFRAAGNAVANAAKSESPAKP